MRLLSFVTVFLFSFSLAATGFAEENGTSVSKERLTPEELNYLVNEVLFLKLLQQLMQKC
ncbi:hypothetical protein AM232_08185 [Bacillus sp. FJAT-21352]|nr:hypothetical protein AM232_08185 [Bacillus sp. FJAT-21352]